MERYVIVCLIKGEALEFHENVVTEVCKANEVKRQKLPAHFTIKAPFETENIGELEALTEKFCAKNHETPIKLKDYGYFGNNVVYMDVRPSKDSLKVHDNYIDELKKVPWLEWKRNEGKGRVFHCTIVSKIPHGKFQGVWNTVQSHPFDFDLFFDNISILRWNRDRWVTYKEYPLK